MAKIEMTKEMREQLLGLLPFSVDATEDFTPEEFKKLPKKYKPVFKIRPWTKVERDNLNALGMKYSVDGVTFNNEDFLQLSRPAVLSCENLIDIATGETIEYTVDKFDNLPKATKEALYTRISRISGLLPPEQISLK